MSEAEYDIEMERAIDERGRSRSRSIIGESSDEADIDPSTLDDAQLTHIQSLRRRSQSFSSLNGDDSESDESQDVAKRAAALSKMYLAGSAPVDVLKIQETGQKKVTMPQQSGALSAQALDALSEGLQLSLDKTVVNKNGYQPSEEEEEEKKMEMEEKQNRCKVDQVSTKQSLVSRAAMFKNKMMKNSIKLPLSKSLIECPSSVPVDPSVPRKKHKLKLLLLGDSGVGKTSLMRVFSGDTFSDSMLATAGVDFKLRQITIGGTEVTLQIWDTAGQERFHRITATYYKGANGIVLVYDVTDKRGFENVEYWMNNIRQFSSPNLPAMLLVGNKIDLSNRTVASVEGETTAKQYNCRFIETSAKTSENINDALETIAQDAYIMSVHPELTQKALLQKNLRNKENCVIS